jgi:uroporphyrin-III C-methyltransferase
MYEPPTTPEPPPTSVTAPARSAWRWLLLLLVLLLLGAAGAGAYYWWQQQRGTMDALRAARAAADARLETSVGRNTAALAQLATRADLQERAYAELKAELSADRNAASSGQWQRLQLTLVEHLLLAASERLQLARDVSAARAALELADARLATMRDPRLLALRESIAGERAALSRVPQVDEAGALLSLSALIESAVTLPLAASVPERFEPAEPAPLPADGGDSGWWPQVEARVREALGAMFSVRKARGPAPRLLTPQQEVVVQQILMLRLEAARVALLRGAQPQLRDSCAAAAQWLRLRFHPDDSGVQHALAELERIGALPFDAPLPDLSESLGRLRALLAAAH